MAAMARLVVVVAVVVGMAAAAAAAAAAKTQRQTVAAIAHRGDNQFAPENTMASFESAIAKGATHLEIDIRTTADGELVCIHDSTVDRTTNGTGRIRLLTLAEIKALDAGSWFGPQFADQRVPRLSEVFDLVRRSNVSFYLDLKDGTAEKVYNELRAQGIQYQGVIYSGPVRLKQLQVIDVGVRIMPPVVGPRVVARFIEYYDPVTVFNFSNELNPEAVALVQAIGADIYINRFGEFDNPADYQLVIDGGATGIQTNDIGGLVTFLRANGYYP